MVGFTESTALNIISEKAQSIKTSTDTIDIFKQAMDLNLLQKTSDNRLSFSHEMYQEYFCAEELLTIQEKDKTIIESLQDNPDWEEPIILFSGLIHDNKEITLNISQVNPHLAVKCIQSFTNHVPELNQMVVDITLNNLTLFTNKNESYKNYKRAITYTSNYVNCNE